MLSLDEMTKFAHSPECMDESAKLVARVSVENGVSLQEMQALLKTENIVNMFYRIATIAACAANDADHSKAIIVKLRDDNAKLHNTIKMLSDL